MDVLETKTLVCKFQPSQFVIKNCSRPTKVVEMKVIFFVLSAILSVCVAQNNVDWSQVRRIHEAPPFFDDFPYLQALFQIYNTVNLNDTEGQTSTRNQFNYMVSYAIEFGKEKENEVRLKKIRLDWF